MRPVEDLTAKARIRDTALRHFAEHGVKGATLRAIADDAGVSLGLVQHHFGAKEGLRDACDAYVVAYIKQEVEEGIDKGRLDDPSFVEQTRLGSPLVLRYLGRALVDGSPTAAGVYDELVAVTERFLAGRDDARGHAAVFTTMQLGIYVLHEHLSRALGTDMFTPETMSRVGSVLLNIVSPEFVGPDLIDRARSGLDRYTAGREAQDD
ncbi:TetR/AcrR family transcriptional regulator [Nonomuraea sp. NPDC050643]|uniref:TetR/AcrR family transcriptional regulator n=1 Tax=Nonomuraea sp. NPDC050643 TaxID=3155660 RepID=UPI0033CECF30